MTLRRDRTVALLAAGHFPTEVPPPFTSRDFARHADLLTSELLGFPPDVIELQLAHKERAAYNRAERLAERRSMMQQWANYLDGLRSRRD